MLVKGSHYINGDWEGGSYPNFQSINPSTLEPLAEFPSAGPGEVEMAVKAARNALPRWRSASRPKRCEFLAKIASRLSEKRNNLAEIISLETGKSLNESMAEVIEALHMAEYAASTGRMPYGECLGSELAEKDAFMIRKPKGVIGIISPWNFPAAIGAFWCAAPALAEGNTVVWKPSEETPWTAQFITMIYGGILPLGVFNVIHGDGNTGKLLVKSNIDHILFTGSAEVGKEIRKSCAETWNKTCSLECGSKSAVVIFPDAKRELAIEAAVNSAFKLSGQRCVSAGRILVHQDILHSVAQQFVDMVKAKVTVGDPFEEPAPFMGPLINATQKNKVEWYNQMVRETLDKDVILDSAVAAGGRLGHYLNPFVYISNWAPYRFLHEEVFGPHVAIIPFKDVDDAIRIYNDTEYGLSLGIMTEDMRIARKMRDECDFGMGYWNGGSIAAESHLPFTGVKKSGNGWGSAANTYKAVTHEVAWTVNYGTTLQFPQGLK